MTTDYKGAFRHAICLFNKQLTSPVLVICPRKSATHSTLKRRRTTDNDGPSSSQLSKMEIRNQLEKDRVPFHLTRCMYNEANRHLCMSNPKSRHTFIPTYTHMTYMDGSSQIPSTLAPRHTLKGIH